MANDNKVNASIDDLNNLIKSLKTDYVLQVGILGSKAKSTHDKDSGQTNAEIGTHHEFGTKNMPRRSFLEDSLRFKLKFDQHSMKKMRESLYKQMFVKHNPKQFLKDLGAKCLEIIEEGFASNGFGKWQPLSDKLYEEKYEKASKNYNRIEKAMLSGKMQFDKNTLNRYIDEMTNPLILTDTGKMRHSITFKVKKRK